jgi:hypothetical protein
MYMVREGGEVQEGSSACLWLLEGFVERLAGRTEVTRSAIIIPFEYSPYVRNMWSWLTRVFGASFQPWPSILAAELTLALAKRSRKQLPSRRQEGAYFFGLKTKKW